VPLISGRPFNKLAAFVAKTRDLTSEERSPVSPFPLLAPVKVVIFLPPSFCLLKLVLIRVDWWLQFPCAIPLTRLCLLPQLLQHIRQIKPHHFSPQPHRRNLPIRLLKYHGHPSLKIKRPATNA
jgi:hypothetical protein